MTPQRTLLVVLLAASAALPACRIQLTESRRSAIEHGERMSRTLRSYHAVTAAHAGHVGFLKVYDVAEQEGPTFTWKYVYDLDFNEVGFVDQNGTAYRYHRYAGVEQEAHRRETRLETLPEDSVQRNVMRMLGIDPATDDVTFPTATSADIAGK